MLPMVSRRLVTFGYGLRNTSNTFKVNGILFVLLKTMNLKNTPNKQMNVSCGLDIQCSSLTLVHRNYLFNRKWYKQSEKSDLVEPTLSFCLACQRAPDTLSYSVPLRHKGKME